MLTINKPLLTLPLAMSLLALLTACQATKPTDATAEKWVGTWTTAQQLVEPHNVPPEPALTGNTLRQVARVSLGGRELRMEFSNEYSSSPVTLQAARLAQSAGRGAIVPATEVPLTFAGKESVTLAPGAFVVSDPVEFVLAPRSEFAVTLFFGETSADITGHPGSRTTSYLKPGNALAAADLTDAVTTDHWYVISGLDVKAPDSAAAVVVLGDSISDGRGSGTNKQNRWPDELANRLHENMKTRHVAVLNQGIGGNCVLRACLGPSALDRFERDVLDQAGVAWLVILEGINDIGQAQGETEAEAVAEGLINAYTTMIEAAHAQDVRVYGATLMPFGGSFYDSPEREAARQQVNEWIRTSGRFDAVIDLDAALRDPHNPTRLKPEADTGDHLHPNEAGHRMIAEAVDLALFASE